MEAETNLREKGTYDIILDVSERHFKRFIPEWASGKEVFSN